MYDQFFEPRIKEKDKILNTIRKCKNYYENYFGYGPIFYTNNHNKQWHLSQFELLCDSLHRFVKGVYIDFDVNEYCRKSHKLNVYQLSKSEQDELLKELKTIADKYGLQIFFMKKECDFDEDEIDVGLPNCCPYACEYCPSVNNRKSAKDKYEIFDSNNTLLYGIMSQKQKIVEVDLSKIEQEEKQEIYEQSSLLDFI
jgi:hypothetical protein